jgi:hypothetical protein
MAKDFNDDLRSKSSPLSLADYISYYTPTGKWLLHRLIPNVIIIEEFFLRRIGARRSAPVKNDSAKIWQTLFGPVNHSLNQARPALFCCCSCSTPTTR